MARCAEDESVAAQDVGGTRNVKHHGQQKGTCIFLIYSFLLHRAIVLLLVSLSKCTGTAV